MRENSHLIPGAYLSEKTELGKSLDEFLRGKQLRKKSVAYEVGTYVL